MEKKKKKKGLQVLNGLSISEIEIDQEGNLTISFDLPVKQESTHYALSLSGTRILDVYEHKDLQKLSRDLFRAARKHLFAKPDPDLGKVNCDLCKEASCCRNYNVILSDEDIDQMRGKIPHDQFIREYTDPAVDWTEDFPYQIKSDEDEVGEKCVFLKRDGIGRMRCSIYEKRPHICRAFDVAICDEMTEIEE